MLVEFLTNLKFIQRFSTHCFFVLTDSTSSAVSLIKSISFRPSTRSELLSVSYPKSFGKSRSLFDFFGNDIEEESEARIDLTLLGNLKDGRH